MTEYLNEAIDIKYKISNDQSANHIRSEHLLDNSKEESMKWPVESPNSKPPGNLRLESSEDVE
ncbi:MAG: hypothetical protein MHMPM18_001425 [Marteilia pararefringens]